ncbi:TonB-dependent receptor [Nitrospira moscoviensis]|uniref:Putative Vitamin B12 transporter BtuB n=1 Tax=Nitrospira moscoviensis TaxID=42253 RepID=A0A0K2GBC1_NITMO|nr:TonB-dependent receptor [Nitrospira moscoviensis]ALA58250.1 putative Vitamin B12 transporter BtuB [Nitrospira moscoviensis]
MSVLFWSRCSIVLSVCLSLPLVIEAGRASAGDGADPDAIETREVVISATKTPVPVEHLTSSVQVITGEYIERRKIRSVIEALRLAEGVFASSSGGPGTEATVKMRGAFARHTLVLIDGVIVNSPTTGAYDFGNLTAENIDRIEILRGAQSMLYGSDAMGGVINIYTKRGIGRPTVRAFAEYGSFTTLRESAQVSGAKGPFDLSASLLRWDASSFSAINYRRGATERDGFHNWNASGKLGVSLPKDGRLEFNFRWYNSDVNFDGFADSGAPADILGSRQTTRNLIVSGVYSQPITSWWSQALTLARSNQRSLITSGPVGRNLNTGEVITASPLSCFPNFDSCFTPFSTDLEVLNHRLEWQHNIQVGKPLLLTAGYQFREEQGDASGFFGGATPNKRLASHAGFAQAQVSLWDRVAVTGGIRQDHYNIFGDATTYRVTAGYLHQETGTKLRASYGTGFRAPTLNDLFFQGFGNPNLQPEKNKSADVGVDQSLFDGKLKVSVVHFWNRFDNLITFLSVPSPNCPQATFGFCPVNVASAKTQGWETSFRYQIIKELFAYGQYTMTMTRAYSVPGRPENTRLPRWPFDQATAGLEYHPIETARVNLDYRFVGARNNDTANSPGQKQGSFGVFNVSASYDVTKQWQVYARAENLLNQRYEEILFFGTPVRSIFAGVKLVY